jgi:hypothetical protein
MAVFALPLKVDIVERDLLTDADLDQLVRIVQVFSTGKVI